MDTQFLLRFQNVMKSVKKELLFNEDIRKLLVISDLGDDLSTVSAPVLEEIKDYIFLQPIIDTEVDPPFNKPNYITITSPEMRFAQNKIGYVFRIIVMCDKRYWTYGNDQIRPLILAQKIIDLLDGKKYDCASPLEVDSIVETVTSKTTYGYSILFNLFDGTGEVNDSE